MVHIFAGNYLLKFLKIELEIPHTMIHLGTKIFNKINTNFEPIKIRTLTVC